MREKTPKVVVILQARMGSSRLPGKVLADIAGRPMLALIIERVLPARYIDQLIVATPQSPQNDPIETLTSKLGVPCFRGAENDCLDRYYHSAKHYAADVVVRLTSDNPLVDSDFVDWMIKKYIAACQPYDYIDSSLSKTFPLGLSVEVFSFEALEIAWKEDTNMQWREHVTPYIYRHPNRFRILHVASRQVFSNMRWTVDTFEDLAFVRRLYDHFGQARFSWRQLLGVLAEHPDWLEINRHVQQKVV